MGFACHPVDSARSSRGGAAAPWFSLGARTAGWESGSGETRGGQPSSMLRRLQQKWNNIITARRHFVLGATKQAAAYSRNSKEPKAIKEALEMEDAGQWKQAIGAAVVDVRENVDRMAILMFI